LLSDPEMEMNSTSLKKMANVFGVAALFLRLGFTAFGGPVAHIAMMEEEVVVHRGWISRSTCWASSILFPVRTRRRWPC